MRNCWTTLLNGESTFRIQRRRSKNLFSVARSGISNDGGSSSSAAKRGNYSWRNTSTFSMKWRSMPARITKRGSPSSSMRSSEGSSMRTYAWTSQSWPRCVPSTWSRISSKRSNTGPKIILTLTLWKKSSRSIGSICSRTPTSRQNSFQTSERVTNNSSSFKTAETPSRSYTWRCFTSCAITKIGSPSTSHLLPTAAKKKTMCWSASITTTSQSSSQSRGKTYSQ